MKRKCMLLVVVFSMISGCLFFSAGLVQASQVEISIVPMKVVVRVKWLTVPPKEHKGKKLNYYTYDAKNKVYYGFYS